MAQTTIQGSFLGANTVDGTKIALGSDATGDIMYYNGTDWIRSDNLNYSGTVLDVKSGTDGTAPGIKLYCDSNNLHYVLIKGGAHGSSTSYTLTLPPAAPTANGQALTATTGGVASWAQAGHTVTGTTANGILTYTDGTNFASEANLTFNGSTNVLALTGTMTISSTLVATGTVTTPSVLFKGSSNAVTMDVNNGVAEYSVILPDAAPTGGGKVLQTASGSQTQLEWGTPAAGLSLAGTTSGNQITTVNSSTEINGEAKLTFNATNSQLKIDNTAGSANFDRNAAASNGQIVENWSRAGTAIWQWGIDSDGSSNQKASNSDFAWYNNTGSGVYKIVFSHATGGIGAYGGIATDGLTIPSEGISTGGVVSIYHTTGGALMDIKDTNSSGTGANGYIRWQDQNAAQVGYIGKGSSNGTMQVQNESAANMTFGTSGYTRLTIAANGTFSGSATNDISDQRIKENIEDTTVGLAEVLQLRPVKYNFVAGKGWGEPEQKFYGFLAQEVEEIIPEAVETADIDIDEEQAGTKRDPNGIPDLKSVTMTQITTALVKAVQELNAKVTALGG